MDDLRHDSPVVGVRDPVSVGSAVVGHKAGVLTVVCGPVHVGDLVARGALLVAVVLHQAVGPGGLAVGVDVGLAADVLHGGHEDQRDVG